MDEESPQPAEEQAVLAPEPEPDVKHQAFDLRDEALIAIKAVLDKLPETFGDELSALRSTLGHCIGVLERLGVK